MRKRDIVVVGASAGGIKALAELVESLRDDLDAAVFVVLHIPPYSPSRLPEILSRSTRLNVVHPEDGDKVQKGKIYVASPDKHLLCENGRVIVRKGPKENRFRPSVDALFRSAAYTYGSRVIGVVLSGALNDGTSGLWTIKRLGGIAIIQDPDDASFKSMPDSVINYVGVDHSCPASEMGEVIANLTNQTAPKVPARPADEIERLELEVVIAKQDNAFEMGIMKMGELTPFTCPDCEGAFVGLNEGRTIRYRCHTGHAFTMSALLAGISETVHEKLWQAMRGLEESTMLLSQLGKIIKDSGHSDISDLFYEKSRETSDRAQMIHDSLFTIDNLSEDIRQEKSKNDE